MKKILFKGSGVAIITPFNNSGVDFGKLEELIENQIANKTDAIIICGTTGETPTMANKEKEAAIEFTVKTVNQRISVIAGTGSNNTKQAIEASKHAQSVGVDGILSVVPYYNKPTQRGLYEHFKAIAESVASTPIILYNVPGRTVVNLDVKTTIRLSEYENIVAIKECVLSQIGEIKLKTDLAIYTGEDSAYLPALCSGAHGVISVMANIIPKDTHMIYEYYKNNELEEAQKIYLKTLELINALFIESNPVPTKTALNLLGKNVGGPRLPLVEMETSNLEILKTALKNYGLL
ncbi:MAG: 4-hydroxy-tetrahydrodipicolinate synthase [Candidatus Epulonipiscioides saccharophilum]|nr:MAG: 4-hydroxy-tetrahydrodipicolinate synthase [Epulopiscium sp. AS2M-Bin001]